LAVTGSFSLFYVLVFSPGLLFGNVLAVHETFLYFWPAFFGDRTAWTTLLFSGYPLMGDPQAMMWYPPSLLFSWLGGWWNAFVLSAYVLASSFTYGYVYCLTRSKSAAAISAVMYGMSGFLMIRLVHTNIIHTAAWLPLLVWSLEMQRHRQSRCWMAVTSIAVACGALAGHPQIWAYMLGLAALYVLIMARGCAAGWLQFLRSSLIGVLLGVGLAAVLIVPMIELAGNSVRSEITRQYAVTYSLGLAQLPLLLFPFLSTDLSYPSILQFRWLEVTGYVGFLSIIFAIAAVIEYRKKRMTVFWCAAAVAALLFALGPSTPIGNLSFVIPIYSKFRAPGRHIFEFVFAICVLSGQGFVALRELTPERRMRVMHRVLTGLSLVMVGLAFVLARTETAQVILLPFAIFALCVAACLLWARKPSPARSVVLLMAVLFDLGHFSYLAIQRELMLRTWNTSKPSDLSQLDRILSGSLQRMSPVRAAEQPFESGPPNLSRLWGIANVSGYNPLVLRRYAELAGITPEGRLLYQGLGSQNRSLDLLALRYLLVPKTPFAGIGQINRFGMEWRSDDLDIELGSGCGKEQAHSVAFKLPDVRTTKIGIVSSLGCSIPVTDGADLVTIAVGKDGSTHQIPLKAGIHTSEWAWDRADVQPSIRHSKATVFGSFASTDEQGSDFLGHRFVGILPIPAIAIRELRLEWVGTAGMISIRKMSLSDETDKNDYRITWEKDYLPADDRWRHHSTFGETTVYENMQAMPRAWIVPKIVTLSAAEILETIQTSKFPDGTTYQPEALALTEVPIALDSKTDPARMARVSLISESHIQVRTQSSESGFLVLSDTYYPGWEAGIDGQPTTVYRTNYLLRGVVLPPGDHIVDFRFRPLSLRIGLGLSTATALILAGVLFRRRTPE